MYQPDPTIRCEGQAGTGYESLVKAITAGDPRTVLVDTYHAPGTDEFMARLRAKWEPKVSWFDTREALKDPEALARDLDAYLTDDPVFGRVCDCDIDLFFDPDKWLALCRAVRSAVGPVVVIGPGAVSPPLRNYADCSVIAQVPRETVFTSTLRNLGDDQDRSNWERYKRNFYVDWPVLNRHQFRALPACDLLVDISAPEEPSFVPAADLLEAFRRAAERPFRVRSLFMPGIWGGTRLRELIPDLPKEWPNCAWGFELVGPENTVTFEFPQARVRMAFDLLMHHQAASILGRRHYRRYGEFFPIRFDFLDTIGGDPLSCQVHPDDAYINAHFREPCAQQETYYIMEATEEATVYLGLTEDTSPEQFLEDVRLATTQAKPFAIEKHVNAWPSRTGDLFLIPAGTVHCSGAGNLVLEISATPYIYTFKIYDYLRPDLDGKPRPISYQRAFEVLDFSRTTAWVQEHLLARPTLLAQGEGWARYLLADHPLLFHVIERIELSACYQDSTEDGVHVLCVVEGPGVLVTRLQDGCELSLEYAETGILPAACGGYRLTARGPSKVVKCFLR
jgi:mannose-6-phosphate isomerase class I